MKRLIGFFIGLLLIVLTFAMLYFTGAIYDANKNREMGAFIMQPNNFSTARIGRPQSVDELSDRFLRDRLIGKFIHEYLYVVPDTENIKARAAVGGVLSAMVAPAVFDDWRHNVANEIEQLATDKYLRRVVVNDIVLPPNGDFWEISYETRTYAPNDMNAMPVVESGVMFLKIKMWAPGESRIRDDVHGAPLDVNAYLKRGGDPAAVFKFVVEEVK